nr:MAG TPA: hypothetical protein [Caudoviricetes sp.]
MKFECVDAKQEFENILKSFETIEIKSIDEFIDEDGIYYSANIIMSDDATSKIDKLIKDNGAQFIDNGEYMFDTKYGYCDISDDGDQFTIECFVPIECCEPIDESMIPVEESLISIKESAFDDDFILDIVKMGYETGHQIFDSYEDFIEDEEVQDIEDKEAAWDFYCDLIDMGPAGFYEEYRDELDFDPDFIAEYGNDEDLEESLIPVEETSNPKLGKKVKSLKGWKIYQGTDNDGDEIFRCFIPDEDRPVVGYEDWECETLDQAISWIENYDLDENYIPITKGEDTKESIVYNNIHEIDGKSYEVNIVNGNDPEYYDVYVNNNLWIQEPKNLHDEWTINEFKLLAFNSCVDLYRETIFKDIESNID